MIFLKIYILKKDLKPLKTCKKDFEMILLNLSLGIIQFVCLVTAMETAVYSQKVTTIIDQF